MTNRSVAAQRPEDPSLQNPDPLLTPALFQSLFLKPRYLIDSPVTVHLPFMSWLAGVLRPRSVCVLGADDGVAHFAFCQALDQMGIDGDCSAFGFWRDTDASMALAPPPKALVQHEAMLYDGLSHLLPCETLDAALVRIALGSLDLLFCDLTALPAGTQVSGDRLLERLAPTGVLVLHGIGRAQAIDFEGFHADRPHVLLPEGEGISVWPNNFDELPHPLLTLIEAAPGGHLRRDVARVFRRSGQSLQTAAAVTVLSEARNRAEARSAEAATRLASLQNDLEDLKSAHVAGTAQLAQAQDMIARLEADVEALRHAEAIARAEGDEVRSAKAEAAMTLAALRSELEAERGTRFTETAALTRMAQDLQNRLAKAPPPRPVQNVAAPDVAKIKADLRAELQVELRAAIQAELQADMQAAMQADLQAERAARRAEVAALQRKLDDLRRSLHASQSALAQRTRERDLLVKQKEALLRRIASLLQSTSWRVTAPLRAVRQKLGLGRD
jgi:hypothetical protein